ncbi:hypothetical protein NEQG_01531 [Nematocida parisii ERTm3]|uniref:Uncharacterized protein n=1 Tax=Nematocida parisii (strain ERTm3) TaxID=935791 RepID=I3EFU0_NEMP3|nr:hypothetical protein NEQG_01531 [Nematocida parisii ERTm3]
MAYIKNMLIRKGLIIGIITLCRMYCRVGLNVYEDLHNKEIGDGLCIRTNGPLFPARTFASEKCDLMHSMRFLSPGMDINYILSTVGTFPNDLVPSFSRYFNKDKAYKIKHLIKKKKYKMESLSEEEKDQLYVSDYHQTLVYLFPSTFGDLSIYTNRNNSFMRFIQSKHVLVHRINILASLFLLAEGVDVPLKIEGTRSEKVLVLKKIGTKEDMFSLSMIDMCNIKQPSGIVKPIEVKQREAVSVINFFIENKTNPDIREGGKYAEPRTHEDFKTGKFLKNARWLIQYYIFEYLGSESSIIELAKAVYSMLKESIKQKEKEGSNVEVEYLKSIIDKCFVKYTNNAASDKRMHALNLMYGKTFLDNAFPFSGCINIPSYRSISSYNRNKNENSFIETYSNCVEAGLLGLFCCLAYDAETKEYTTVHMGEVSSDLKKFFTIYNKPFETADYTIYNEWNKVVADLENENIKYLKENRNELVSGIINMLYVITEITGRYSKDKETIKEFYTRLEGHECKDNNFDENQSKLFNDIKSYITELFISLSKKCNSKKDSKEVERTIKIDTSNMSIKESIIEHPDIFGKISITYSVSELEGEIILEHSNMHLSIKVFYSKSCLDLITLNQTHINNISLCAEGEKNTTLTDYLIARCIERPQDTKIVEPVISFRKLHPENINISEENNYLYPIEKLFLYNKFRVIEHTMFMIHYIRECLVDYPFEDTGPWARLISNLLGSLPLNDYNVINHILYNPLFKKELYNHRYKKITTPAEVLDKHYTYRYMYGEHVHVLYCESLKRILQFLKTYISMGGEIGNYLLRLENSLLTDYSIKLLSLLTCGGENITYLSEIAEFIDNLDRNDPRYTNTLTSNDMWSVWFKMCFESDIFINIIEPIFDKFNSEEDEKTGRTVRQRFDFSDLNDSKKIEIFLKDLINKSPETRKKFYYAIASHNRFVGQKKS